MKIWTGSLKYSPVFKSHSIAFGKSCERKGHEITYIFSYAYRWMLPETIIKKSIFVGTSKDISSMFFDSINFKHYSKLKNQFLKDKPEYVYLHNYHILNHYIAHLCETYGCNFIYHVHEPYIQNKKMHGRLYFWLYFFEYFQSLLLLKTHTVIVSSKEAFNNFIYRYHDHSKKITLIPLMYEDINIRNLKRKYITFVGPPVSAKNPDKFLEIVNYALLNKIKINFLLVTRKNIPKKFYIYKNLRIFYKDFITDEEYGKLIKQSIAVLTPYKRETQSSVILVSYMHGTPVVSSNIGGLHEFVDKRTGILLDVTENVEKWLDAIIKIFNNFEYYSINCRAYYKENFSEKNWDKYLDSLFERI